MTVFTRTGGTGIHIVPNLSKCPVPGAGIDVSPNIPKCPVTGIDVVPNLPKCPVSVIPAVYTGGMPRYVPRTEHALGISYYTGLTGVLADMPTRRLVAPHTIYTYIQWGPLLRNIMSRKGG